MSAAALLAELKQALDEYRYDDVRSLVDGIDPGAFDEKQAKKLLGLIRRKRLFPELERAASVFAMAGHQAPVIKRQWAQALIDQNRIGTALTALESMRDAVKSDTTEGPEIRGLIGRAYKQRFVFQGTVDDLRQSVHAYRQDWHEPNYEHRWHGINFVALLARASRDGIDVGVPDDFREHARRILEAIELLDEPPAWDLATAMEAAVALGDKRRALAWAKIYVKDPGTDAFELGATIRQLKEIWRIEDTVLGASLLPILEYELLQRKDGTVELSDSKGNNDGFEAVYGAEGYTNFEWIDTMYKRGRAVGRVAHNDTGARCGTGWVVKGSDLKEEWGDRPVFVTNSHVLSPDPADEAPLAPGDGEVEFTRIEGRPKVELGKLLFTSPRVDLDVSVCEIVPPDGAEPLKTTMYKPVDKPDDIQRIFIVGHPNGGEMTVSLFDNDLAGYEEQYVRYKSPTDTGHSGSPVFNRQWKSFAVHHRARAELQVNEGVLLEAIVERLKTV